jgi:hypothetical protein
MSIKLALGMFERLTFIGILVVLAETVAVANVMRLAY